LYFEEEDFEGVEDSLLGLNRFYPKTHRSIYKLVPSPSCPFFPQELARLTRKLNQAQAVFSLLIFFFPQKL